MAGIQLSEEEGGNSPAGIHVQSTSLNLGTRLGSPVT